MKDEADSTATICAPITAVGIAAIAVIRVSGSLTQEIIAKLCLSAKKIISSPRSLIYSPVVDLLDGEHTELDSALVSYFPAPHSFTGEDCAEFQIHGSPYLIKTLMDNLIYLGASLAQPGEFSKRAYLNGKLDLAQAEAISDLILSETKAQARVAKEQLNGKLSKALQLVGEPLRDLLAEIEAFIDFPEEDIPDPSKTKWKQVIENAAAEIGKFISSYAEGRIYRDGAQVALVGRPNAGKSSLLNALVGEERAIVTNIPGTTRDSIEERICIGGVLVRLWDTAGLAHDSSQNRKLDVVEVIGIERSWQKIQQADLVLYLVSLSESWAEEQVFWQKVTALCSKTLLVFNKSDLLGGEEANKWENAHKNAIFISTKEHRGLNDLRRAISTSISNAKPSSAVYLTTRRHYDALCLSAEALKRANSSLSPELLSLEVREALRHLEEIVGVTYSEDILGRIFSKFCIGK
ncbi:MAG: tRNA uridine-5-carboxymethylaminomethyl(34) synthesis GTPase MnmE [Deltaproteobacteria bacterium]|nr:tRNA uridine-5-carboxymethylaminomethyl(34) synthesis GTPase MnmE [Deltaproteobacteria bacterium]